VSELNGFDIPTLNLRRLIRHAITNRIFIEPEKGHVAHTRMSRLLLEDAPLSNWVGFMCNDLWLPIANVVGAMKKWPGSEESTETGVNLAYNQSLPWFDYLQQDEDFAKRYNLAMQAHGGGEGYSLAATVEGYQWGDLPKGATVVDVGVAMEHRRTSVANAGCRWAETKATFLLPLPRRFQICGSSYRTRLDCAPTRQLARCPTRCSPGSSSQLTTSLRHSPSWRRRTSFA